MLESAQRAYFLLGVEPAADLLAEGAAAALAGADFVVAATPWASAELRAVAHVLLPIGTFAETSGTYVNLEGPWQSFAGAAQPVGEARPGWKVLRVLGTLERWPGSNIRAPRKCATSCAASCPRSR